MGAHYNIPLNVIQKARKLQKKKEICHEIVKIVIINYNR